MTTKIKICHLTTVHAAFDTRIFHKQAKTLANEGYDVSLIAQNSKNEIVDMVKIVALPKEKNRIHRMFVLSFIALWRALRQKADLYHFHDPELIPIGVLLKLLTLKKVICDVHEDYVKQILCKQYIPRIARKSVAFLIKMMVYLSTKFLNGIIVAGDDIAETFDSSLTSGKLTVIRNVPLMEFVTACSANGGKIDNMIIYLGGLQTGRGIKEIVEAANYVKNDAKFLLIGPFETPQFEREIRRSASENVQFIGKIKFEEVPDYIKAAKIGLICFYPEPNNLACLSGRNNKLYEYMAGGLAIIGSNFPKWKEVIEGGNFGITVNPKNPRDIARAIDYLLDNPESLKQMAEKGIKAVHEQFSWDNEKEKLLQIYSHLLKRETKR
ncbi:MAG: glycosyltransferase family 4 protein [Deltaproteobacteria bacterium]|nr:glycosyltransferase family 4 protein [Deltaproteobacteria bacterium]